MSQRLERGEKGDDAPNFSARTKVAKKKGRRMTKTRFSKKTVTGPERGTNKFQGKTHKRAISPKRRKGYSERKSRDFPVKKRQEVFMRR